MQIRFILLPIVLVIIGACRQGDAASSSPETEVDARIVSLSGFLTELLYYLDLEEQLVGRDVTSTYPEAASTLPNLGHVTQLNLEAVLQLAPDFILLEEQQLAGAADLSQLKQAGVQILVVPTSFTLGNAVQAARFLQQHLTFDPQKLDALQQDIERDSLALQQQLQNNNAVAQVVFIYARGANRLLVSGSNTAADAIIRLAGAENAIQDFEGFKALSAEGLVTSAPTDILLLSTGLESLNGREGLATITGIQQTPAFQQDRIHAMDGQYLLSFGPRVGRAALELSKRLYTR